MKRRAISLALAAVMTAASLPGSAFPVFAEEAPAMAEWEETVYAAEETAAELNETSYVEEPLMAELDEPLYLEEGNLLLEDGEKFADDFQAEDAEEVSDTDAGTEDPGKLSDGQGDDPASGQEELIDDPTLLTDQEFAEALLIEEADELPEEGQQLIAAEELTVTDIKILDFADTIYVINAIDWYDGGRLSKEEEERPTTIQVTFSDGSTRKLNDRDDWEVWQQYDINSAMPKNDDGNYELAVYVWGNSEVEDRRMYNQIVLDNQIQNASEQTPALIPASDTADTTYVHLNLEGPGVYEFTAEGWGDPDACVLVENFQYIGRYNLYSDSGCRTYFGAGSVYVAFRAQQGHPDLTVSVKKVETQEIELSLDTPSYIEEVEGDILYSYTAEKTGVYRLTVDILDAHLEANGETIGFSGYFRHSEDDSYLFRKGQGFVLMVAKEQGASGSVTISEEPYTINSSRAYLQMVTDEFSLQGFQEAEKTLRIENDVNGYGSVEEYLDCTDLSEVVDEFGSTWSFRLTDEDGNEVELDQELPKGRYRILFLKNGEVTRGTQSIWFVNERFTVTWDGNGGQTIVDWDEDDNAIMGGSFDSVAETGETVCLEERFERDGYVLVGWTDQDGNEYDLYDEVQIERDMTFTANWAEAFTITWDGNGGFVDGEGKVSRTTSFIGKNQVLDYWMDLLRTGMVLEGWTTVRDDESSKVVIGDYVVTGDVTLYAFWKKGYTITFDPNGASIDWDSDLPTFEWVIAEGDTVEDTYYDLIGPEGKIFLGWTTIKNDVSTLIKNYGENAYRVEKDDTLYAYWADQCLITFDGNGHDIFDLWEEGDNPVPGYTVSAAKGAKLYQFPGYHSESTDGFMLAGWSTSTSIEDLVASDYVWEMDYIPQGDVTLYAIWTPKCQVTWDGNGHKINFYRAVERDTVTDEMPTGVQVADWGHVPLILNDGETFLGWSTSRDAKDIVKIGGVDGYKAAGDVTLYAIVDGHVHTLVKTAAKAATCDAAGNIEYYTCSDCKKIFSDAAGTKEITRKDTVKAALGHEWDGGKVTKAATCKETGVKTFTCKHDRSHKKTETIAKTAHTLVKTGAKAATTEAAGNIEYYTCSLCGKVFADARGTKEITLADTVIAKLPNPEGDPNDKNSIAGAEKAITKLSDAADPAGSSFTKIQVKSTKQTKNSITVTWNKVKGAAGYIVYGNTSGKTPLVRLAKQTKNSFTYKGLKKGTYYKFSVVAYQKTGEGKETILASGKTIHAATKGGKVTNASKVKLNKTKVTLKKKGTFKLKATVVKQSEKLTLKNLKKTTMKYESSNAKVATVDKNGKIKAKKKGTATIYAYAQNGVFAKIKVTVK